MLKLVGRSAFDLQEVLNTLVESALQLCNADAAAIWRPDGDVFTMAAYSGFSHEWAEFVKQRSTPTRTWDGHRKGLLGRQDDSHTRRFS